MPNLLRPNLVFSMADLVLNILTLAALSYLGVGVQPPTPEWGAMIADGQAYLLTAWWFTTLPGLVVVAGVAFSLIGDGLADRLGGEFRVTYERPADEGPPARGPRPDRGFPRGGGRPGRRSHQLRLVGGPTLGLVGESGCGKSVTLRSILGLVPAPGEIIAGEILFDGRELRAVSRCELNGIRGTEISMIFQDPMASLNPVFSVGDQLTETLRVKLGLGGRDARSAIELLDRVGIPSAAARMRDYPHQFSGGMRQRVMIALAIAARPRLLLADEPTTALDVTIQDQILALLAGIRAETGMAMILVSHDVGVIAQDSDDVAVMYAGHVVERGPPPTCWAPAPPVHARPARCHPGHRALGVRSPPVPIPGQPPDLAELPPGCPSRPGARRPRRLRVRPDGARRPAPRARLGLSVRGRSVDVSAEAPAAAPAGGGGRREALRGPAPSRTARGAVPAGRARLGVAVLGATRPSASWRVGQRQDDAGALRRPARAAGRRLHPLRRGESCGARPAARRPPRCSSSTRTPTRRSTRGCASATRSRRRRSCMASSAGARSALVAELLDQVAAGHDGRGGPPRALGRAAPACRHRASPGAPAAVIIADEAVSALDVSIQAQILDLFAELRALGLAMMFIAHQLSVIGQSRSASP